MISSLTISGLGARAVDGPVKPPLETASGIIGSAPLVLLDIQTEEGVTGHSYVFFYTPLALLPTARLVSNLGTLIEGDPVVPLAIEQRLQATFRLLGPDDGRHRRGRLGRAGEGPRMTSLSRNSSAVRRALCPPTPA